jgi:hypothetical protein
MYFTVNEAQEERKHIGTLDASSDRELLEKLHRAVEQHFDEEVNFIIKPKLADCCRGSVATITIDLEDYTTQIEIAETWLY